MLTFNSELIIKNKFNHPVHSVGFVPTSANGFGRDEKINVSERLTNFGEEIFVKNIVDESARKKTSYGIEQQPEFAPFHVNELTRAKEDF